MAQPMTQPIAIRRRFLNPRNVADHYAFERQICSDLSLLHQVGKLEDDIKGDENVMSVVSQVVLQADDELRYPSAGELTSIAEFCKTGEMRMRIAITLAENEKRIVEQASRQLWQKRPDFIAPGGNANGSRERALCLRDYGWYMRLITYGLIAGDKGPIESIGLIGVREMYNSLGVPVPGMVAAIGCLKDASLALLSEDEASEAAPYFDFIIQAMS
jgi:allophycocyanin-B